MKKLLCILLTAAMLAAMTACAPSDHTPPEAPKATSALPKTTESTQPAPSEAGEDVLAFVYQGTAIQPNAPAEPILSALGEPKSCTEEASCAFDGLDKTYFYGSFYLQTYPAEDGDRVYCLWLVDDTVSTPEGICIGSTEQQVQDAYGSLDGSTCTVTRGDCKLTLILTDGVVSSIQYDAVLA